MPFIVYKITHTLPNGDIKLYVGVTQRTIVERLSAHLSESTRAKPRGTSEYSLGYATREHLRTKSGVNLEDVFVIEMLQSYSTLDEMREGESTWIAELKTMAPTGYNLMRGGSSIGGPANAKKCSLFFNGDTKLFASFSEAARHIARVHLKLNDAEEGRFPGKASMRMRSGWSLAEAFGLEQRVDRRTTTLSREAHLKGEKVDAARSRMQRKVMRERRQAAAISTIPIADLTNGDAPLNWSELFKQLGVSKSTGRWRLSQIEPRLPGMTLDEVKKHIGRKQDRTKPIAITRPGFPEEIHGINKWATLMKRDGHSCSTIKSRLKKIGTAAGNNELLIALGVLPAPKLERGLVDAPPQSRKKHCSDWTVNLKTQSRKFVNQSAFVNACYKALSKSKDDKKFLGAQPNNELKAKRSLQAKLTRATKAGKTPSEIASTFGILEAIVKQE